MIKNKIKKILNISNIFLKDSFQEINIINYNNYKLNKKSIYFWMILILFFALFFVSQEVIKFLKPRGLSEIFLNIYFLILSLLIMFQTVLVCTNVFYFSKDIGFKSSKLPHFSFTINSLCCLLFIQGNIKFLYFLEGFILYKKYLIL